MPQAHTNRRTLRDHALDQYGFITTHDAAALNVPDTELRKLAHRGGLTRLGHGLYRFDDVPVSSRDAFMEAVLRVGPDAHLFGDAVLALHDLALVNPRRIRVVVPRRDRHTLPPQIEVIWKTLPPIDLTRFEGIPTTTVARAIRDCAKTVMRDRLLDAVGQAEQLGLLRPGEVVSLLADLRAARA